MTVATYYGSLSLQAFMGIKHNFKEEKYQWIEFPVHGVAWCIPAALSTIVVVTENFNPEGGGCAIAKAPQGCEADPDVPCQRGKDIDMVLYIVGFGMVFLYFIFPPSIVTAIYCWIKKIQKKVEGSRGMQQIREHARKQMIRSIANQISLYLFSFWFTFVPRMISFVYRILTGNIIYELLIFANCIFALQGFIMAMVYFTLQRLGTPKVECGPSSSSAGLRREITVQDIRSNVAERKAKVGSEETDDRRVSYMFNIFDGAPDEDSPWARYIVARKRPMTEGRAIHSISSMAHPMKTVLGQGILSKMKNSDNADTPNEGETLANDNIEQT
eukprot:CAMPEP_0201987662 /NCGR_PEP_ID=MMETSP0904-20121228/91915_1 /ASSEMBLY_ACC=CAM_ASM_000553 /TAXON_ID=420261 /ORGANISM="Thalassiosira antarctica, Strain CCMP982" /LENGTH=328 /DNA_ID=CAMNT_0048541783 /DNA_START=183 /DNA_END=1172 /DNA_ORIENTATION=-